MTKKKIILLQTIIFCILGFLILNNYLKDTTSSLNITVKIMIGVCIIAYSFLHATALYYFKFTLLIFKEFFKNRDVIFNLALNDFKTKYTTSYLGILWAFVNPLVLIGTYWFVFQVGFRSANTGSVPFIVWFVCGITPWFFYSEALSSGTNALIEYNYLVKKVVFKVEMLPVVKMISAFFVHAFFILFLIILNIIYKSPFNIVNFQIIYYIICTVFLVMSLTFLTSSMVLFFRDLSQIVIIGLNVGFWFTPIVWSYQVLPIKWLAFFKLNPMYYIVQGYRDTFIDHIWFFEHPYYTLYFWSIIFVNLLIGMKVFNNLKVHFADVI